jgi:GNAT superfamily N-acetyltransferase
MNPARNDAVLIRKASSGEAQELGVLSMRSKAYWGYTPEFLEACREELSYSPIQIESPDWSFAVAELDGIVAGFYALERLSTTEFDLAALFVEPARIGQGVGRMLMDHARQRAARLSGKFLKIQSDPQAEGFYRTMRARSTGTRESGSIPGRYLPTLVICLDDCDVA